MKILSDVSHIGNGEMSDIIDDRVHNARNRNILKRKLCDGVSYDKVAEEYDMCSRQVKRIVKSFVDSLSLH